MVYKEVLTALVKNYKFIPRILGASFSVFQSGKRAYTLPLRAQIENSTVCNLACQMCPLQGMTRPRGFMGFVQFKKIYDVLQTPFLNLTGYGESFLNKEIFKMVSYAKSKGAFVKFDSNGTLLTPQNIEKALDSGLDLLSFSVDGATKKTYEKIRQGSNFEVVTKGIRDLIEERKKRKSPLQVHLAMVVQNDNVAELLDLIKLGESLRVDKVNPTPIMEYDLPGNKKFLLDKYKKELKKVVDQYLAAKNQIKVQVDIEPLLDFLDSKSNKRSKVCFIPWYSTYISWEGDVYPCCYYYNGQIKFGNIFQKSFQEIWNSAAYKKFRETLGDHRDALPICKACSIDEEFLANKIKIVNKVPGLKFFSKRNFTHD